MIDSEGMESEITEQPIVNKNPVVAVIDTGIYIEHEALEDSIWTNSNERENNKDEDGNGFVDDTNGWDKLVTGVQTCALPIYTVFKFFSPNNALKSI